MPFPRRSSFSKAFLPSLMFGLSLLPVIAAAELEKLNDGELSEIDGAGIGLILEDFIFSHGTDAPDVNGEQARIFRIAGIQSTDGREVDITVNHLYIAGSGGGMTNGARWPVNSVLTFTRRNSPSTPVARTAAIVAPTL